MAAAADPTISGSTAAVTPSDGTDLAFVTRSLYVGGPGTLTIIDQNGNTTLFTGVLANTVIPVRAARVKATGTTATNIVAIC
jgi:hypothetical protein